MEFSLQSRDEGTWTVLGVTGEVDLYTAPKLRERITDLVEEGRLKIAVDLTHVEFMDSTGLGVLIGGLKRVRENDGSLAILGPRPPVVRILQITGLDKVLPVHDSIEEITPA